MSLMASLNWTLSQTLNKYSDLARCDRAYHQITNILSLVDDPEIKLLRKFLSSSCVQNRSLDETLYRLVWSLEKKMKSEFSRSLAKLVSATTSETLLEEKNVRTFLESYGQRLKVRDKLFQQFSADLKKLSQETSELTEKEVERIKIPDLDCNISELYRNLVDWKPKYEDFQLSKCAQWVLSQLERCLSQLEEGRNIIKAGGSQVTEDSEVRPDLLDNREAEFFPVKTDNKSGVLRDDKMVAMLEVEIKAREKLMVEKQVLRQELTNTKEELTNTKQELANTKKELTNIRQEMANTKKEKDNLEAELYSVKEQLESHLTTVLTSIKEKLEAKERELKQKDEEISLLKHLEEADSRAALLESQNKELVSNNGELNMKVENLQTETEELKARLECGAAQSADPDACITPKISKRGHFFTYEDTQVVSREEEREENITDHPDNQNYETAAADPVACSTPQKSAGANQRDNFYSIEDLQKAVREFVVVESAGDKLLDFLELISEESRVVSRKIIDVILEESPLMLKTGNSSR